MAKPLAALAEVFKNLFREPSTRGYPFREAGVDGKFRARVKYLPELCVGCQMCVRNCPANAISITLLNPQDKPAPGPDGKMIIPKRSFECKIDLTRCIFCAQCVDSCFKKALYSSQEFELASTDKSKLTDITKPAEETAPAPANAEKPAQPQK
jgi:formate hydrogenlyase subunit 6/NADH:ubiquinone oxidoreductase subunit I